MSDVVFHKGPADGVGHVLGLIPDAVPDAARRSASIFLAPQRDKLPALVMVGRIAATQHVTICDLKARDGSEVPCGLLYSESENPTWTTMAGMYVGGCFDTSEIRFAAGWTLDTATAALAKIGIHVRRRAQVAHVFAV